jgi:hypothetical protein
MLTNTRDLTVCETAAPKPGTVKASFTDANKQFKVLVTED